TRSFVPSPDLLSVRVQELEHGAAGCVSTRQWPLRTLIAYLFDGRECDEVRALLATGEGVARGARLTWPPTTITAEELTEIENTFPPPIPVRQLTPSEIASAELVIPADKPKVAVSIRPSHPVVAAVLLHAVYERFDYGPWADLFTASLTRDDTFALLADIALGVSESENIQRASMLAEVHPAVIRLIAQRAEEQPPWQT
ncbi:MAG: hypothetical protein M3081_12170, partial [Gemmatimonadota bacterium]|nr:hypothetical protein [Gemmatimonadota bacterium]